MGEVFSRGAVALTRLPGEIFSGCGSDKMPRLLGQGPCTRRIIKYEDTQGLAWRQDIDCLGIQVSEKQSVSVWYE